MWQNIGYNPVEISSAWFRGKNDLFLDWPQFQDRTVIFSHRSRISIAAACKLLNIAPGDEILVPSYNCGSEIDPLLWFGAKVVFYRIDLNAKIDFEDLRSRLTSKTHAVYVTHYFGWLHPLAELKSWCKEHNLYLIEDCALSPLSEGIDGPAGLMGDASIHCFWKILPLPDGGALSLPKTIPYKPEKFRHPDFRVIIDELKPFMFNWLREKSFYTYLRSCYKIVKREKNAGPDIDDEEDPEFPGIPLDYYFEDEIINWDISKISRGLIARADRLNIIAVRRRNYKLLYDAVQDLPGIHPLFNDFPIGICPLVFPLLVPDRSEWQRSLNKRQIYPLDWWYGYHLMLSWKGFPEAVELKNKLLVFLIDQYKDENYIAYLAEGIKEASIEINKI